MSEADPTRISLAYERWAGVDALKGEERTDERDVKDPFGLNTPYVPDPNDPWARAKEVAQKMLNFSNLLRCEGPLLPEELLYATELLALNTFNLADLPVPPERVAAARKAAFLYYSTNR